MPDRAGQTSRRDVALAFATLAALLCGHSILETARDALFLSGLPASQLPWVYLIIAGLAFAVVGRSSLLEARAPMRLLAALMSAASVCTTALWLVGPHMGPVFLYVLYVWTGLVATVAVGQFWLGVTERFDVGQAKRAFAKIAAGGLIGATAGSALSGLLIAAVRPTDLLLAAAFFFVLAAALARSITAIRRSEPARAASIRPDRGLVSHPYLLRILWLGIFTALSVTILDLVFKSVVAERIATQHLGWFFAAFYTVLNGLSLVVQLFLATWLLRTLGVNRALWILPSLAFVCATGFVTSGLLVPVLLMKVVDGSLRHSLHRTSSELLYMPIPAGLRARYKVAIDAIGSRGGQALACLVVLGVTWLGGGSKALAVVLIVSILLWSSILAGIKREYVELFRRQLRSGTIETRTAMPELDLHSLETLISALNAPEDDVVINAMELLSRCGRGRLIPGLILYHPSSPVVIRALEIFAEDGRRDALSLVRGCLHSVDPEIRAASLRAAGAMDPSLDELHGGLTDPSALVRATATVGLVASGLVSDSEATAALDRIVGGNDRQARIALVRTIAQHRDRNFDDVLLELMAQGDVELEAEVARAVAHRPSEVLVDALVGLLAERRARPEARAALLSVGELALDHLERVLVSPDSDARVRLHVPRTISRFESARAVTILLGALDDGTEGPIAYKILRGLGRLLREAPWLVIDQRDVDRLLRSTLRRSITLLAWRHQLERSGPVDSPGGTLLASLLYEKENAALERVFRILGLFARSEDFEVLYQGMVGHDAVKRASSREVFENLDIPADVRAAVLVLMSNNHDGERLEGVRAFFAPVVAPGTEILRDLLYDDSDAVSALAAHIIGELGLGEMEDELEHLNVENRPFLGDVVARVRQLLAAGDLGHVH